MTLMCGQSRPCNRFTGKHCQIHQICPLSPRWRGSLIWPHGEVGCSTWVNATSVIELARKLLFDSGETWGFAWLWLEKNKSIWVNFTLALSCKLLSFLFASHHDSSWPTLATQRDWPAPRFWMASCPTMQSGPPSIFAPLHMTLMRTDCIENEWMDTFIFWIFLKYFGLCQ